MRIAVIGAGPSCLAVYIGLSYRLPEAISTIKIFDPRGLLNSDFLVSSNATFLTNTSAGITSITPGIDTDFVEWLRKHEPSYADPKAFLPRTIYRRYVLHRFNEAYTRFRAQGCETSVSTTSVMGVEYRPSKEIIVRSSKGYETFDVVIIGIGAAANEPLPMLADHTRYISNIYQISNWEERLPGGGRALVFGSKLSAIDATVSLLKRRSDVSVTLASRGGELPAVRRELLLQELPNFNSTNPRLPGDYPGLRSIFVQAARDLRDLDGRKSSRLPSRCPEEQLESDIEACELGTNRWQFAIGHFIEEMNRIWPKLAVGDQREFKRRYSPFISRFVSSFPLQNAKILQKGFAEKKLSVVKLNGGIADAIEMNADVIKGQNSLFGREFDMAINCTGIDPFAFWRTALGVSLREQGARSNAHGGLDVEASTMRISSSEPAFDCYAIGAPVSGSLLVTNYVRASVIQADLIVSDIETRFVTRRLGRKAA